MDRVAALAWLQSSGTNVLMETAGRLLTDTPEGYGPAIDRAFAAYISRDALGTTVGTTTVVSVDLYGFGSLLYATTYDLVLPVLATLVDASVDAPLTNMKLSQMFRQVQSLREQAWGESASYGYGAFTTVGGFKLNLDFLEPGPGYGIE
ncbi:MAG: hypothetical protein M3P94_06940 [Chloroflexota bacterium]|nr:hypothetical protein [Chloroflexota bacterium]